MKFQIPSMHHSDIFFKKVSNGRIPALTDKKEICHSWGHKSENGFSSNIMYNVHKIPYKSHHNFFVFLEEMFETISFL